MMKLASQQRKIEVISSTIRTMEAALWRTVLRFPTLAVMLVIALAVTTVQATVTTVETLTKAKVMIPLMTERTEIVENLHQSPVTKSEARRKGR